VAGAIAASAQTTNSTTKSLTLEECIQTALEHNFDVQIKRYSPEIARYNLNLSYGGYDPTFSFSGEHDYSLSPGGIDPQGRPFGGTDSDIDRFSTALRGLLPWGLTYDLGGSLSDRNGTQLGSVPDPNNPTTVVTNSFVDINTGNTISFRSTNFNTIPARVPSQEVTAGSVGVLQLRQPVLKNFWIDSTRLNIVLSKRNLKISDLDLHFQLMNTVTAVEDAYYNLIFSEENVKVQTAALELAKKLLEENKTKVKIGALAPLDEKQAESQVASSEADLLAALGSRDTQQRVLKNLLSDDYSKWGDVVVKPTETLLAMPQSFNKQESWQKGLSLRPDLLQAKLSLEKQGHIVRFQRNQMFPQLDLFGNYGYSAGQTAEYSGAFDQFRRGDNPFYSAGAEVSIPIGNVSARNNYKAAKAAKEQMALQLKQLEQTVLVQIENSIATAMTSFERVKATRNASEYALAALKAEETKLQNGKSTSFQVLQLQRDLTAARSSEIRALADYNIALSQLALSEGTTLERRKISLNVK
jgi:outer membrane protein TolC